MSALSEHTLRTTLGDCRVRVAGAGSAALVLFPAVMDDALAFGRLQLLMRRRLPPDVATVAVDPPGYGGLGEVPHFSAWPAFCGALVEQLSSRFPEGLVFAGNSSGAVAATEAARLCERSLVPPAHIRRAPHSFAGYPRSARSSKGNHPSFVAREPRITSVRRDPSDRCEQVVLGLAWICWCDWHDLPPRSHELLCPRDAEGIAHLRNLAWHTPPPVDESRIAAALLAAERHRAHVASFDAEAHRRALSECDVPLLVVAGDADGLVPHASARGAAERHPRGRFALIEGSGHYPHREQPATLAAVLAEFAQNCFTPGRRTYAHTEGDHAHAVRTDC